MSGSRMTFQNSFFEVPFSRKRNIAVRMGGKRYFLDSSMMDMPFFHSLRIFGELCFTM